METTRQRGSADISASGRVPAAGTTSVTPSSSLATAARTRAIGSFAAGACAAGAVAFGAVAIGRLAIGALALRRASIKTLMVEDLTVGRLRIRELIVEHERRSAMTDGSPNQTRQ